MKKLTLQDYLCGLVLFLIGMIIPRFVYNSGFFICWINSLTDNVAQLLGSAIQVFGVVVAALMGVWVAFSQIKKQFEHKVIHDAWVDFQKHLFAFSTALSNFDTKILWLKYYVKTEDDPFVNNRNPDKYKSDTRQDVFNAYQELMQATVLLLQSFETHEIIFLSLRSMKKSFYEICQTLIFDKYRMFDSAIFPILASDALLSKEEKTRKIDEFWKGTTEVSGYLDDFRIALQNETVGKILGKTIPRRKLSIHAKILTKDGFIEYPPEKYH